MSTICGICSFDGRYITAEAISKMRSILGTYKSDACNFWNSEQAFLGCGVKYITPESKNERMPFYDDASGLAITADAIIDNRKELCSLLDIKITDRNQITDSSLILASYRKWGKACPKYLVGDFAFAIWSERRRELFCARDHVGKRTFYFNYSNSLFMFGTLMKPILVALQSGFDLNEEWIADFLSLDGVLHEIEFGKTIYKNIMQLAPAHTITVNADGFKIEQYWYPLQSSELRLKSDEEYSEAFKEVFFEAVRCRLRASGDVGVMLSGGLDSGCVASVAATELKLSGKRLKTFSAIPACGYKDWLPKRLIADESDYINEYKKHYDNIDITYCSSEGKNSITDIESYLEILEQPYKIVENLFWVNNLEKNAAVSGCSVILDGQYGNLTISYGDFLSHILTLYKHFNWLSVLREIKDFSIIHGLNPLQVGKRITGKVLRLNVFSNIYTSNKTASSNSMTPINPKLADKWHTKERFRRIGFVSDSPKIYDLAEARKFATNNVLFSHLGPLDTKLALANGLIRRDPTRDKRVVEFCLSLPGEQYVRNGQERYLVRNSMTGILPDPIRTNFKFKGKQSADWIQRLSPFWGEVKLELEEMLENTNLEQYLDIPKLKQVIYKLGDSIEKETWGIEVRMLLISLVFSRFMKGIKSC